MVMTVEEALARNPNIRKDNFFDRFYVPSIAPGATQPATIQVTANAAFVITKASYFVDNAAASQTDSTRLIPLVTMQIEDGGSSSQMMKNSVPVPTIAGTGELPAVWPYARLVMPTSILLATFTNYDAAVTYTNLYVVLHGYKVFEYKKLAELTGQGD